MTLKIQQSEATASLRRLLFVLVDITDGFSKETGLSAGFTINISKAGASQGSGAGSITEIGNGGYYYEFTSGEVDTLGFIHVSIAHANCRDVDGEVLVVAYDPFSATNLGLTNLDTSITSRAPANEYDTELDAVISSRSSHTANNVRDVILSDSTSFAGAQIALINTGVDNIEAKLPTNYIMGSADQADWSDDITQILTNIGNLNDLASSDIQTVLETNRLDELINVTAGAVDPTIGSFIDQLFNKDGSQTFDPTTDSLEAIVDAGGGTDWTSGEKEQIRDSLGVDGTKTAATGGDIQTIQSTIDALNNFDYSSEQVTVATNNDKTGYSISGTITTFDALDTALDLAHGAASWLTGGAGGATIQVIPAIPKNIDLADTKTVRIALYLTDQNDDLPTTGEITPGTIKIDRSADGGTSWSTIRNDVACSEHAGAIYYDEVFSSGNGYASADMIRITFKGQIVTISANDHEITDGTNGMVFITRMDSGLSGGGPSAGDIADAVWEELRADHQTSTTFGGKNQLGVPSETLADYKATGFSVPNEYDTVIAALQTDLDNPTQYQATGFSVPNEYDTVIAALQTDLDNPNQYKATGFATSGALSTHDGKLDTVDSNVDLLIYDADRFVYGGSVWIDDTAANTNTVLGIDGTWYNPVSTLAAALTIATALNVKSLVLMNNTAISLSQSFADWEIRGHGFRNIVTLNSQSVDNAQIINCHVTGTQAGTQAVSLHYCNLDSIIGLHPCAYNCSIIGNLTLKAANDIHFVHCSSAVPGNNTPILTFVAGTTAVNIRHYSGGWEIKSMTADHVMSLESDGQVIINADCTGGAISRRGMQNLTDNSGGAVTITEIAAFDRTVIKPREGNVSYEYTKATIQNATRKVDIGKLNYITIKIKNDGDADWSSPISTKILYMWYETMGDDNPIRVGESD